MPCFLSLRKSPRPTSLPSPSCPQGGHQIIFSEDSSVLNHSRLQKLCVVLKTSSSGEAWVGWFSHVEFLWSEKLILFWALPLFSSQQKRSHNELALSRSWIWKTDSCRGREDVNSVLQSYKTDQESNVIASLTAVLLFPIFFFLIHYASQSNQRYDFAPQTLPSGWYTNAKFYSLLDGKFNWDCTPLQAWICWKHFIVTHQVGQHSMGEEAEKELGRLSPTERKSLPSMFRLHFCTVLLMLVF